MALGSSLGVAQTLIYGPTARAQFDSNVVNYGDRLIDFNAMSVGPLTTQLQVTYGVAFSSNIQVDGTPIASPHEVFVTSTSVFTNSTIKIVGTPYPGGADDGQVGYQIIFSNPQARAGIERDWQTGAALTQFYNSQGTLLASHTNTAGVEFVGYLANYNDPLTWVTRIQLDGLLYQSVRQVGYSDNLIYGVAPIPEPSIPLLLLTGLGTLWYTQRRRREE